MTDYTNNEVELIELFEKTAVFIPLKAVEMPSAADLAADRQAFLDQVAYYRQRSTSALPVPAHNIGTRLQNWLMYTLGWDGSFKRKEKQIMTPLLARMAMIIATIIGVAGTTAVAANNSLPDSPLYTIKLAMEDAELALITDESSEADLHMRLAQTRINEIERLTLENHVAGDEPVVRLQTHLATALQLMATVPESNMNGILLRAQQMAQTNTQSMLQAQNNAPDAIQLGDAYQLMHQFGQEVEQGLENPAIFRQRHTNNRPDTAPEQPNNDPFGPNRPITPTQQLRPGPNNCINEECDPVGNAQQQQGQPNNDPFGLNHPITPTQQFSPGPNNCANEECDPVGNANQYGNTEDAPPYGNRNGAESDPAGNMEQNQPQPAPNGSNSAPPDSNNTTCPSNEDCNNGSGSLEQNQYDSGPYGPGPDQPGPGDAADIETDGDAVNKTSHHKNQ